MRISSQWLNEFVDVPAVDELARVFEMAGIGVESVEDDVFSLEVTSNRGDWLFAVGLAREIAAMTDKRVRFHPGELAAHEYSSDGVSVEIESLEDCTRYMAIALENVQIAPSPHWMQKRLAECGMRAINNIVDITNYVMLETGQPLHAFDADKIAKGIEVRRARPDETLETLDGVERTLNNAVLVIADANKAIGLAGLMGGMDSEVSPNTSRIVLEAAHFAPMRVRRGARSLGLSTEASRRFERHVDPNGVARAANRAVSLLQEHAGARLTAIVDRYSHPLAAPRVRLRADRCNSVLGLNLSVETMAALLKRLALEVEIESDVLSVTVPTFRNDIAREEDLIEEVARVHGYEHIAQTLPKTVNAMAGRSLSQRLEERAKSALLRCGLTEIVTISMQNAAAVERAGLERVAVVALSNPLSEDYTQMRTSLVPSLLEVLEKNARAASDGVRIFELGKIYSPRQGEKLPQECRYLGMALLDSPPGAHWQNTSGADTNKSDAGKGDANKVGIKGAARGFFALKAVVETTLSELGAPQAQWRASKESGFHPGRCATLSIDGQDLGMLGEVHPDVAARFDLGRAYIATIEFDTLVRHISLLRRYQPISRFPVVERDLALVLDNQIPAAQVESLVREAGGELLQSARTFDVYQGAPIPPEAKSLALALRFGASDRTLTDAEVEAAMTRIRLAAEQELNAALR